MTSERPDSGIGRIDLKHDQVLRLMPLPAPPAPSFSLDHAYFELVYEPLIGPAAFVVARNLARHVADAEGPVEVHAVQIAREAGLRASSSEPLGQRSPLVKALTRLGRFALVRAQSDGTVGIQGVVPPVPEQWHCRLPAAAMEAHHRLVATQR